MVNNVLFQVVGVDTTKVNDNENTISPGIYKVLQLTKNSFKEKEDDAKNNF